MTSDLSWSRAKDLVVIGIGTLLILILGYMANGLAAANASLAEVKRDIAVLVAEKQRDREELADLKSEFREHLKGGK